MLLATKLVCKIHVKKLNIKNQQILYFFKLGVQRCQIWHSHVKKGDLQYIPMCQSHSTRPHNAKKALYVIISGDIPENWVYKSNMYMLIFMYLYILVFPLLTSPEAYLGKAVTQCDTSNTQKMTENGRIWAKNGKKCTVENCGTTYPKSKNNCSLFSSIYHVERPVSRYGRLKLKFLCNQISHCIYSFCSIEFN